jgi:ligand-binding sensor domain-containing protein
MTAFEHDPQNANSLSHNFITSLLEDRDGILWITTYGGGLNRFDPSTHQFTRYQHDKADSTSISSDRLFDAVQSHDGKLWLGANPGLILFDPKTGRSEKKMRL